MALFVNDDIIAVPAQEVLFLTDLYQEAVAADNANFGVVVSVRYLI